MWAVFPVHEAHQAKQSMCEGKALLWKVVWGLQATCSEGRNCPSLSSPTFVQHTTLHFCNLTLHMFSHQCTHCYSHHSSSPEQRILSFDSGTLSQLQISAAHFWCDVHMHSTSRDVLLSLQYRQRITIFALSHDRCCLHTARILEITYFLVPSSLC